jgi:hypothetical protein
VLSFTIATSLVVLSFAVATSLAVLSFAVAESVARAGCSGEKYELGRGKDLQTN